MSYSNFSYFNSPNSPNQFSRKSNRQFVDVDRNNKFDLNNQSRQNFNPNFGVSSANRPEEIHGMVTQLFSSFGYINDNIIFSKSDVLGPTVQKGDEVSVYATYQPNNPTKYKGERVTKLDHSNFGKMKTLTEGLSSRIGLPINTRPQNKYNNNNSNSTPRLGPVMKNRLSNKFESSSRGITNLAEFRRSVALREKKTVPTKEVKTNADSVKSNDSDKSRGNETKAEKRKRLDVARKVEPTKRKADSPIKYYSEPKAPAIVKPIVETINKTIPKYYESFAYRELDCAALKNQFPNLTLPKEFFHATLKYQQSFPLNHPMKLGNNCQFKIMDKRVKCIDRFTEAQLNANVDPEDADTTFVAKVMLLSTDDLAKFYKDTLKLAEEFEGENKIPITKAIKFLVGSVGQDKEFGIGGAWSPSLDGTDPDTNPRVLINTAIRTCKAMTGIDLSNCSSWSKFLELHYYRPLRKKPSKNVTVVPGSELITLIDVDAPEEPEEYLEPRMETVVYYLPDVWSCMLSADSWAEIRQQYKEQLTCIMCPPPSPTAKTTPGSTTAPSVDPKKSSREGEATGDGQEEEDYSFNEAEETKPCPVNLPTHFSQLVVAGMKIVDIKRELELRKLNNRGIMEQLKARLKGALDREEAEERSKYGTTQAAPVVLSKVSPSSNVLSEDQKTDLKKLYALSDQPEILVHQNRRVMINDAKLRTMSLHSLLSYYETKLEETTYELAIFAKQFLDMLRRDAVFNIYKSIVVASDADLANIDESVRRGKAMVTTSKRTVDRQLLFSCTLLDREKTGKINMDDLKVLVDGLGICLSCDQLNAILSKVKDSGNSLNYRQLTDKEMTDSDIVNMINGEEGEDVDYIKELAMGNKALFEVDEEAMLCTVDGAESERWRNELDGSERSLQSLDVRMAEMKEASDKSVTVAQLQAIEVKQLRERTEEYRAKYRDEQSKGDQYKADYERLMVQVKDIGRLTKCLKECVSDTASMRDGSAGGESTMAEVTRGTTKAVKRSEDVLLELMESGEKKRRRTRNGSNAAVVSVKTKTADDGTQDKGNIRDTEEEVEATKRSDQNVSIINEDFELAKPSDYDMIDLEDTE